MLAARLVSDDHRREEDSRSEIRSRHPENRKLHVPSARHVEGQDARKVDAEEALQIRAVMLRRCPDQRLEQKQQSHRQKEPSTGLLRGREVYTVRRAEGNRLPLHAVPAQKTPASERSEEQADAAH